MNVADYKKKLAIIRERKAALQQHGEAATAEMNRLQAACNAYSAQIQVLNGSEAQLVELIEESGGTVVAVGPTPVKGAARIPPRRKRNR